MHRLSDLFSSRAAGEGRGAHSRLRLRALGIAAGLSALVGTSLMIAPLAASAATAVFAQGTQLQLPANASASVPDGFVSSISCSSVGNCTSVGEYGDNASTSNEHGFVEIETAGSFAQAIEVMLPTNATTTAGNQFASLNGVSCSSAGNCSAVGSYSDSTPNEQAMTVAITNGTVAQGVESTLPANANVTVPAPFLNSVSCSSIGNCTAAGNYEDTGSNQQALIATESTGIWATAVEVTAPPSAVANPEASLNGISCTSAGNCTGVGVFSDTATTLSPMIVTESNGSFGTAGTVALPVAAQISQRTALFNGVSCSSIGNCTAVGFFTDAADNHISISSTETAGAFAAAVQVSLPANAVAPQTDPSQPPTQASSLNSVSCTSAGNCTAVGSYNDAVNGYSFATTETSGSFAGPTQLIEPANLGTAGGSFSSADAVACPVTGVCLVGGEYADNTTTAPGAKTVPMLLKSLAQLAVTTSSLPGATVGQSYSSSLAATGGSGTFTYSVSSGTLPAGLSLSSAGVISGTPTAGGTSSVTFKVSDNGPPAQSATAALSIAVAAGVAPLPVGINSSMVGTPTSATVLANSDTTVKATDSNGSATVTVPAGALPTGTVVSIYPILNGSTLASGLPQGKAYELAFAVSWVTPAGTAPPASKPITMVVLAPSIHRSDSIYQVVPTGLQLIGTATHTGITTLNFSYDPGFVFAATPKVSLVRTVGTIGLAPKRVVLMINCRTGAACHGSAVLTVARRHHVGKRTVVSHVTLATAKVALAAGKSGKVTFHLTAAGMASFARSDSFTYFRMSLSARIQGANVGVFPTAVR